MVVSAQSMEGWEFNSWPCHTKGYIKWCLAFNIIGTALGDFKLRSCLSLHYAGHGMASWGTRWLSPHKSKVSHPGLSVHVSASVSLLSYMASPVPKMTLNHNTAMQYIHIQHLQCTNVMFYFDYKSKHILAFYLKNTPWWWCISGPCLLLVNTNTRLHHLSIYLNLEQLHDLHATWFIRPTKLLFSYMSYDVMQGGLLLLNGFFPFHFLEQTWL